MRPFLPIVAILSCALAAGQQSRLAHSLAADPKHQLLLDQDLFTVYRLELHPAETTTLHKHDHDYVEVALSDVDESESGGGSSWEAKPGDARFIVGPQTHEVTNRGRTESRVEIVELKRHWAPPMRRCEEPRTCTREIQQGEIAIGETTSLLTNGFLSVQRHHLIRGASLTSSYFSRRGKDRIVLIPITDLEASFDGTLEKLKAGQVYYSQAAEVEVTAAQGDVTWDVVRVNDQD